MDFPLAVKDAFHKYIAQQVSEKQLPVTREYYKDYAFYPEFSDLDVSMYAQEMPYSIEKRKQTIRIHVNVDCTDLVSEMREEFEAENFDSIYQVQCMLLEQFMQELLGTFKGLPEENAILMMCKRRGTVFYASQLVFAHIQMENDNVPERSRYSEYYMHGGVSVCRKMKTDAAEEDLDAFLQDSSEEWQVERWLHRNDYVLHLLAFAMGFHARLGVHSCVKEMDPDIVWHGVAPILCNPPAQFLGSAGARGMMMKELNL